MEIQNLYLEMSRKCTLKCEHCCRGEAQMTNISEETLYNIFNNVKKIDVLLFTGGEPLVAMSELEKAIELIRNNKVEINEIRIVTNGTALNSRILKILKDLAEISKLIIKISYDMFHLTELERLKIKEKRDHNIQLLKEYFGATEFGKLQENDITNKRLIIPIGRAKNLTEERIKEINSRSEIEYSLSSFNNWIQPETYYKDNKVYGTIDIDVNGNVVSYGLSFEDEDEEAEKTGININRMDFEDAMISFSEYLVNKKIR